MSTDFAASVARIAAPIKEAESRLKEAKADLDALDHPFYAGPSAEIAATKAGVEMMLSECSGVLCELEKLTTRIIGTNGHRDVSDAAAA